MAGQPSDKSTLKALRQIRKVQIERARQSIKENGRIIHTIREHLAAGPRTIPELAAAMGVDSAQVLRFVMALKKYGEVAEDAKEDCYFKYALIPAPLSSAAGSDADESA